VLPSSSQPACGAVEPKARLSGGVDADLKPVGASGTFLHGSAREGATLAETPSPTRHSVEGLCPTPRSFHHEAMCVFTFGVRRHPGSAGVPPARAWMRAKCPRSQEKCEHLRSNSHPARVRTSSSARSTNAARGMAPRSSPARVRTATAPVSCSLAPIISIYGTFCN